MRPARAAPLGSGNELPSALGEEAMVRSGHKLRAVFQRDPVRRLDYAPMSEDSRLHITPVPAFARRSIEHVTSAHIGNRSHAAVSHEKRGIAVHAVHAPMLAAPVGIDRLRKAYVGRVVARDDRARALLGDAGLQLGGVSFLGRPAVVEWLARERLEAAGGERAGAPQVSRFVFHLD